MERREGHMGQIITDVWLVGKAVRNGQVFAA